MISQGYYPVVGGAERQLASLAPRLVGLGVKVSVYTRSAPGAAPYETADGVTINRLDVPRGRAVRSLAFTLRTLTRLRRERPDLVHAHDLFSPTTTALLARRWLDVPVVVKVVRGGTLGDVEWLRRRRFGAGRLRWICANVDRFVCISEEIDTELAALGVETERRVAIPNGVDTERFRPAADSERARLRRDLGIDGDPVFLFTGRLASEKRLHSLLDAWPAVRAATPRAQLLLIGSGDERASLARRAIDGVRLVEPVDDVAPWLRAADAFVLPSAAEGLSNALLEAMATGLACVATDVGGARDVVRRDTEGLLVPPGDDAALQDALIAVAADEPRRNALGDAARARIVGHFGLDTVARKLAALYEVVARR